jgi:hypothetical protein
MGFSTSLIKIVFSRHTFRNNRILTGSAEAEILAGY